MSDDRRKPYPFDEFEPRWQTRWLEEKTYRTPGPGDADFDPAKPKFYVLDMFPYPSGAGLHVGHPEGYTATDIIGRYKRMTGHNVLHPMGWDAFGLPAEQYAIKTGQHPRVTTEANVANFRRQLQALGFAYDWDREVNTTDPDYVRWTQWIFLQLYGSYVNEKTGKAAPVSELEEQGWSPEQIDAVRLAYIHEAPVNWSPSMGTVLANEEIEEWKAKGETVERRPLRQWMLRITKYAQRLIDELEPLDWPESIKLLQRNWIGRSEGAEVTFDIGGHEVTVFTTRPDTLFGATYMVLAPEHPLVADITTAEQKGAVEAYIKACASKSDMERGDLNKDKSGVFTGATATNPVNGEQIPVWIADYVMMGYGTGAIMAVPAHDERDYEFATKFDLPVVQVVQVVADGSEGETPAPSPSRSAGVPPASSLSRNEDVPPASSPFLSETDPITTHRRRLPHWQQSGRYYFVTWRLADSLPSAMLERWREERDAWLKLHPQPWDPPTEDQYHDRFSQEIDRWLDQGSGECVLRDPQARSIVTRALHHFHGHRYNLECFVVMPNHVHVAFRLFDGEDLEDVLHSWKSYTSKEVNRFLGRDGTLWQREYFDRIVRDPEHLSNIRSYVAKNPGHAKLKPSEYTLFLSGEPAEDTGGTPALLEAFSGTGVAVNSGFLNGLPTAEAKKKIIAWLEEQGKGTGKIQFKLRDWLFSRQRYWGEPFPLLWDKETGDHAALPEEELPLLQPEMEDFKPTGDPRGPLVNATDWINYSDQYTRETNTMPQWAGSCWYYLRYCDPRNKERFISEEAENYWMGANGNPGGVDLYVGGTEHAVLHLLYARFWHKVLHDLGHLTTNEPFQRLVNQGLILGETGYYLFSENGQIHNIVSAKYASNIKEVADALIATDERTGSELIGIRLDDPETKIEKRNKKFFLKGTEIEVLEKAFKMSKSRGNVVNPDDVVSQYGADALRLYEMFMGPLEQVKPWQMKGVEGISRFLAKVWRVAFEQDQEGEWALSSRLTDEPATDKELLKVVHETIRKVGEDIEKLSFNTAISQMMVCTNAFTAAEKVPTDLFLTFLKVLNPFAPHLTEEINARLGNDELLSEQEWPEFDEQFLVEDEIELVVQVNGKVRAKITVPADASNEQAEELAKAHDNVRQHTDGKTIRKVIVVPGRLVNIVAN